MTTTRFARDAVLSFGTGVLAASPSSRFDGTPTITLSASAPSALLWGTSFSGLPRKSSVASAVLSIVPAASTTGSVTFSVSLNDSSFSTASTWLTKPGTTGTAVTRTVSSPAAGVPITVDLSSIVQAAVLAGTFPGVQVSVTSGADVAIDQTQTSMSVDWTVQGAAAAELAPDGTVGVNKPTLSGFPTDATAVRVSIDASSSGFGSPDWTSGTVTLDQPQLDLSTTTYPGGALSTAQWWIASFQAPGGGWSNYSDPIKFTYVPLPALTLTGPSQAFPYVTDPSPTFTWKFTGQTAYRVFVTLADGDKTIIWDSDRVKSSSHSVTMPAKDGKGNQILKDRSQYRVWVQAWDSQTDRVAVPGANVYAQSAQVFSFTEVGGVPPFSSFTATQVSSAPLVQLEMYRTAGTPDQISIWRDDAVLESGIDPADIADVATGGWKYIDDTAAPNTEHVYYAEAVVNGDSSMPSPRGTVSTIVSGVWLVDKSRDLQVLLINENISLTAPDQATMTQPLGSRAVLRHTSAVGYLQGNITGTIADDPISGRSAVSYENDLTSLKAQPADSFTVFFGNKAFRALGSDIAVGPDPNRANNYRTSVSLNVWQIADLIISNEPPPVGNGLFLPPDHVYKWDDAADGTAITVGQADVTATAGSPVRHHSATLGGVDPAHVGIWGWSSGSITRALSNPNGFTREYYGTVPSTLSTSWSNFTIKNPASTPNQPCDIRWRTGGTIDMKAQDGSIPDSCGLQWSTFSGKPFRSLLRGTWNPDTGQGTFDYWLTFDYHIEDAQAQTEMHGTFTCDQPANIGTGTNSVTNVALELERAWDTALFAPPYGTALPAPPLSGLAIRLGHASQTTMEIAGCCWGDGTTSVSGADLMGCNRSTAAGMTSPTQLGAAIRDAGGFRRWSDSGLSANTSYYYQLTKNGTPVGAVHTAKTLHAVGTPCTVRHAVGGCQQGKPGLPASAAAFNDIVSWAPDAFIHLGDDTYCDDLDQNVVTHQKWITTSMVDPGLAGVQKAMAYNKLISDHDDNGGSTPAGNAPTFNDPVTATSLLAWASSVPATFADTRSPKRGRYTSHVEGNFRFVYLDNRSMDRTDVLASPIAPNDPASTMLGATQKTWFKAEIDAASLARQLLVVYTDPGWLGTAEVDPTTGIILVSNSDKWCAYTHERDELSTYIKNSYASHGKAPNALIVHSDSHAIQWDDGTNSKGAGTSDINGLRVLCGGPFDQNIHALSTFVASYAFTFPSNADADGRLPQKEMYFRVTYAESPAGTVTVTPVAWNCTPRDVGSTPAAITGGSPGPWVYTL